MGNLLEIDVTELAKIAENEPVNSQGGQSTPAPAVAKKKSISTPRWLLVWILGVSAAGLLFAGANYQFTELKAHLKKDGASLKTTFEKKLDQTQGDILEEVRRSDTEMTSNLKQEIQSLHEVIRTLRAELADVKAGISEMSGDLKKLSKVKRRVSHKKRLVSQPAAVEVLPEPQPAAAVEVIPEQPSATPTGT